MAVRIKVREVASNQGWNAARLARRADISNTAMYGIWSGRTTDPGIQTLAAIAKVLDVGICDLVEDTAKNNETTERAAA